MQDNFKPWYVGWKICYKKLSDILKQFYEMPSFLPKAWMLDRNEWIFMGTPGFGAHSHLDYMGVQKGHMGWRKYVCRPSSFKLTTHLNGGHTVSFACL